MNPPSPNKMTPDLPPVLPGHLRPLPEGVEYVGVGNRKNPPAFDCDWVMEPTDDDWFQCQKHHTKTGYWEATSKKCHYARTVKPIARANGIGSPGQLILKEGGYYRSRRGELVGPLTVEGNEFVCAPFRFIQGGGLSSDETDSDQYDLVAEETNGIGGEDTKPERTAQDRDWRDYPLGTKAHNINGGHWLRMKHGWKWNGPNGNGGTFPTPGGDALGECVELAQEPTNDPCESESPKPEEGAPHLPAPTPPREVIEKIREMEAKPEADQIFTCPASRHVAIMAEELDEHGKYIMLDEDPKHCAGSLRTTVDALWKSRSDLAAARATITSLRAALEEIESLEPDEDHNENRNDLVACQAVEIARAALAPASSGKGEG